MVNTAKALAAFQETLVTGRTAFDDYRDAVARADAPAAHRYPPAARRGLLLFVGSAGCVQCHAGPTLSDGRFHQVAVPDTAADQGRFDDLATLRASAFTRFGRYSDRPAARPAPAADADRFAFRTPSLRQVSVTAPYLHDGRVDELQAAVGHGDAQRQIDAAQRVDLVAFLHTLTDRHGERRPASVQPRRCP